MKKLLLIGFFVLSSLCFAIKDIAGTGEYTGYRKLVEHKFDKKFDMYFKVENNNGIVSEAIKIIPLYPGVDLKEKKVLTLPNGEKRIATRENWYRVFRELNMDYGLGKYFSEEELYNEWFSLEYDIDAEEMLKDYIEKIYYPKVGVEPIRNRFSDI